MKIAHVTSSLSKRGAGVRSVVIGLARAQRDCGVDARVFGLSDSAFAKMDYADWGDIPVVSATPIGPSSIGFSPALLRQLARWRPDLVHLHGIWMYPSHAVNMLSRKEDIPYVISTHGMLSEVALSYSKTKKRIASRLFQKRCFHDAAAIVATSRFEEAEIKAYGLVAPVYHMSNGVEVTTRPVMHLASSRQREVISLGRLHKKKGLDILIDAWSQIERIFPDWRLRLIGPSEGGYREDLEAQVQHLGLSQVSIEGPVYGIERDAILAKADIFVLPTRSENFALTVSESLMMGTPVIASKAAPWADLEAEGCGLWIDLGADQFASALKTLMALNDAERGTMGIKGRAWMIRDFSWSAVASQSIDVYKDLL